MAKFDGMRVLVVEDELLIAVALEEALEGLGFEVVGPFPTIAQALGAVDREPVNVALLDVNVRGEMVFPVAERLEDKGVPVVFCTGYADLELIPERLNQHPCVGKPCEGTKLETALSKALN